MTTNKQVASALMKLKTPKKPKSKTPTMNELKNLTRVATFIKSIRSKKPKNNTNKKKAASNFLKSAFTPRKNVKK